MNTGDKHFISAFLQGQWDCGEGKEPQRTDDEAYMRGYSTEYQHEQNQSAMSDMLEAT